MMRSRTQTVHDVCFVCAFFSAMTFASKKRFAYHVRKSHFQSVTTLPRGLLAAAATMLSCTALTRRPDPDYLDKFCVRMDLIGFDCCKALSQELNNFLKTT